MLEKEIKNSFRIFNKLTNNLINALTKYDLDEHSLIFITKRTKNLMSFTQKILLKITYQFLKTTHTLGSKITDDMIDINKIIDIIFDQITRSLINIETRKVDENKQQDIDDIVNNLLFLKNIVDSLSEMILYVIKFHADIINEEEFREDYRRFKKYLNNEKKIINVEKMI